MPSVKLTMTAKDEIMDSLPRSRLYQSTGMPVREHRQVRALYLDSFREDEVKAARLLELSQYNTHILNTRDDLTITSPTKGARTLRFDIGYGNGEWPNFGSDMNLTPDNPQYDALMAWMPRGLQAEYREQIINKVLNSLVREKCNTSGQLMAVWPDVVNFLPGHVASGLNTAKRGSQIPAEVTREDRFWLPHISTWLAMATLLPDNTMWRGTLGGYDLYVDEVYETMENAQIGIDPWKII